MARKGNSSGKPPKPRPARPPRVPVKPPPPPPVAEPGKSGKPTLLSEGAALKLEAALRAGATMEGAAAYCGIGRRTFFDWLRKGRDDEKLGLATEHADFVERIDRAIATCEVESVELIAKAGAEPGGKFWTARAFLLERRDPKNWARRPEPEAPPEFDFSRLNPAERRIARDLLRKARK